jgi:tRNA A37 threonylcarbamoyladenosine dehydratase
MFDRLERIIGSDTLKVLNNSTVLVVGLGGVGSYVVEGLVRSSIGHLILVDFDKIDITNLNRQLMTDTTNIGLFKTDVLKDRVNKINPACKVDIITKKLTPNDIDDLLDNKIDYVVDACDDLKVKLSLIKSAKEKDIKIISSMGMANKIDPSKISIMDISKTSCDPLAKLMRHNLHEMGINHVMVVCSCEVAKHSKILGSTAFVPSVAGLTIAAYIVRDLGGLNENK